MADNFKLIKEFIQSQWCDKSLLSSQFDDFTDAFYTIEIIRRAKDNARSVAGNHKFKTYYIRTIEDLDKYENEIKLLCDTLQMRAYISINHKSMKRVTLNVMAEYANRIAHDDFNKTYSVFDSCAAKYVEHADQLWIIDVDRDDVEHYSNNGPVTLGWLIDHYIKIIESCEPKKKIVTVIPTKSGVHIVTHPFNTIQFGEHGPHWKSIDELVKKNHPTLLYENIK